MGICQTKLPTQTILNSKNWQRFQSNVLPSCHVLQNIHDPQQHSFLWFNPNFDHNTILAYKKRQTQQMSYLLTLYETGKEGQNYYVLSEDFVRLKEIKITYSQAIIVAYESLKAFQSLMREYGGFIAKDDMIFLNKEGFVKVWINENVAENEPAYPHPRVEEEEFIQSVINQINRRIQYNLEDLLCSKSQSCSLVAEKSFSETLKMLKRLLMREKVKRVKLKANLFSSQIDEYKYSKVEESSIEKSCMDDSKQIKFVVGKENCMRKYTLEKGENPFYKNANSTLEETIIPRLNTIEDHKLKESFQNQGFSENKENIQIKNSKMKDSSSKIERKETFHSSGKLKSSIVHVESRLIILERKRLNFKRQ